MTYSFRVVIATSGGASTLSRTLQSLSECFFPESYQELLVVENGDKAGIDKIVANAPSNLLAKYVHFPEANKSAALNYVFSFLPEDCLVYLTDDDICFSKTILVNIDRARKKRTRGIVLGGALNIDCREEPPEWMLGHVPFSMKGWNPLPEEINSGKVGFLGANWAVFVGDVSHVGGFDPRFGPGSPLRATGQESQMQRLLRREGVKFEFVQNAEVSHYVDSGKFDVKFVIDRHFRMGVESGIYTAITPWNSLVSVFRVPYRLIWNTVTLCYSMIRINVAGTDNIQGNLSALTAKHHALGFFKGFFSSAISAIKE